MMRWVSSETHGSTFAGRIPNITGTIFGGHGKPISEGTGGMGVFRSVGGAFYNTQGNNDKFSYCPANSNSGWAGVSTNYALGHAYFNASRSSNVYNSPTLGSNYVEPAGLLMYYIIKY